MSRSVTTTGVFLAACLSAALTCSSAAEPLFIRTSTMHGTDIPLAERDRLSVAFSTDGLNWQRLFAKPTLTNFSRDASAIRFGDEYVTVYTEAFNSTNATFALARSTDLVNWTPASVALTGPAMSNTPNNTWAPEWFVDGDRYFVMVRSGQVNSNYTKFPNYAPPGIGWLECLDPGTWTNWTDFQPITDLEPANENDPFLIKVGSTYHLFTDNQFHPTGPAILHRQSTNGPFTGYGPPVNVATNFANAPAYVASGLNRASPWEGQYVVPLGGNRYRLYFQAMWFDASFAIESADGMQSWDTNSMQRLTYDGKPAFGHGSVMTIEATDALLPLVALAQRADQAITEVQTIQNNPNAYNLYTATDLSESRTAGRAEVTDNPTNYGLYTPQMITDLNLGGVMMQKTGSNAVVNLQLQTAPDLSTSFTNHGAPVAIEVDLPGNKHFLRIRALGPQ